MALKINQKEAERIARKAFINLSISYLEFISQRRVIIDYKNLEEINKLKGSGVIIVTAHTGNWDILERAASDLGLNIGIISRRSAFSPLQRFLEDIRKKRGESIFNEDARYSLMSSFIKTGGRLGIAIDQNMPPKRGRTATFFSKEVNTTYAPQILSIRTGAPILPVFVRRIRENRFEVEFFTPYRLEDNSDTSIFKSMNTLNNLLEDYIKRYPDQWLWVHRRFKPLK